MAGEPRSGKAPTEPSGAGTSTAIPSGNDARERERFVALGRLAASIAHEINGCLAGLGLHLDDAATIAETFAERNDTAAQARLCDRIEGANECATRIAELVEELRRFGRPDGRRPEPVRLDDVARAALRMMSPLLVRARVELMLGHPPEVLGQRGQLVQVAVNLLRNAADAFTSCERPSEANRLVLSTFDAGPFSCLRVEDNGPGIAPDLLTRLPEPYLSTKPEALGGGLGLSICDGIVTAHGGTLRIESSVGVGTRVDVKLPVAGG